MSPRNPSRLAVALLMMCLHGPALAQEPARVPDRFARSALRPDRSVEEQMARMKQRWPDRFGIALVEAVGEAESLTHGETTYSTQEFRPVGWIFLRWLVSDPPSPGDRLRVHYWFRAEESANQPRVDSRRIAFLEPAGTRGELIAEMLLPATDEHLHHVQRAIQDAGF